MRTSGDCSVRRRGEWVLRTKPAPVDERFIWVTQGDRWKCLRCGACCKSDFEDGWLGSWDQVGSDHGSLMVCANLLELTGLTACIEYRERSPACRSFPFSLRRAQSGLLELVVHRKCPGFGKGPIIDIDLRKQKCLEYYEQQYGPYHSKKDICNKNE